MDKMMRHSIVRMNNDHYKHFLKCDNRRKIYSFDELEKLGYPVIKYSSKYPNFQHLWRLDSAISNKFKYGTYVKNRGFVCFSREKDATIFALSL